MTVRQNEPLIEATTSAQHPGKRTRPNPYRDRRPHFRWQVMFFSASLFVCMPVLLLAAWNLSPPQDNANVNVNKQAVTNANPAATGPAATGNDPNAAPPAMAAQGQVFSKSLLAVIRSGGPLMIPLAICSFVLLVFVFERVISLRKSRVIPGPLVSRILEQIRERQIDRDQAIELCEENPYPVCEVLEEGVRKWGRASVEVEQAILDSGERVSNELKRNLRLINGIATVSPLLGMLGTVLGMIHAFDAIATISPGVDPKTLIATGISQALLTTAAGLTVAIPALIAHLYFTGCVDRRVMEIDAIGLQLVRLISAEGLAEQNAPKPSKRKKAA